MYSGVRTVASTHPLRYPTRSQRPLRDVSPHDSAPATVAPSPVSLADKLLLSDREVALLTGSSRSKVRQWLKDGRLRSLRLDGLRKVRREDLAAFIDQLGADSRPQEA